MKTKNKYPGLEPTIVKQVQYHAQKLKGMPCFEREAIEDIEQTLLEEIWSSLPKYDASRGALSTFVDKIMIHRGCNLLRLHLSKKHRMRRDALSLEHFYLAGRGYLKDRIPDPDQNVLHTLDDAIDYDCMTMRLPEPQRLLCETLRDKTITETAEQKGTSRGTVYNDLERVIRMNGCAQLKESPSTHRTVETIVITRGQKTWH